MQWIIDLLIDKFKKDNNKDQWEPEPLWVEDYPPISPEDNEDKDKDNDKDNVIVIDL